MPFLLYFPYLPSFFLSSWIFLKCVVFWMADQVCVCMCVCVKEPVEKPAFQQVVRPLMLACLDELCSVSKPESVGFFSFFYSDGGVRCFPLVSLSFNLSCVFALSYCSLCSSVSHFCLSHLLLGLFLLLFVSFLPFPPSLVGWPWVTETMIRCERFPEGSECRWHTNTHSATSWPTSQPDGDCSLLCPEAVNCSAWDR